MFSKKEATGQTIMEALKRSDIASFKKALDEVYKGGDGKVWIMKRQTVDAAPGTKGEVLISEVIQDSNFFETVQNEHKDGIYTFKIFDSRTNFISEHHFGIGDISPQKKKKKKDEDGDGSPKKDKGLYSDVMTQNTELIKMLVDNQKSGGNGLTAKDMIEVMSKSHDKTLEILAVQNQGGSGGTEIISAFMEGFQLRGEVQPQIEREDGTTAILQAVMPLIGNIIGKKQGIAPSAVDPGLLRQIEQAVSQRLQGIPGSIAAPVSQGQPPAPGESQPGLGGSVGNPSPTVDSPSPPASAGTQEYFTERYIDPFRRDAAADQPAEELAYQIVSMVQYARDRMAENPPPLVAGFIAATDMMQHDVALSEFFAAIPELANLTQKCAEIRDVLIAMFTGQQAVTVEQTESVTVEETDSFENVQEADATVIQDTQIEEERSDATEADNIPVGVESEV